MHLVLAQGRELAVVFIWGLVKQSNNGPCERQERIAKDLVPLVVEARIRRQENQGFGCRIEVYWMHTDEDHAE